MRNNRSNSNKWLKIPTLLFKLDIGILSFVHLSISFRKSLKFDLASFGKWSIDVACCQSRGATGDFTFAAVPQLICHSEHGRRKDGTYIYIYVCVCVYTGIYIYIYIYIYIVILLCEQAKGSVVSKCLINIYRCPYLQQLIVGSLLEGAISRVR